MLAGIAALIAAVPSCKKDKPTDTPAVYDPVPLTVEVPSFVKQYAGDMQPATDNALTVEGVALGRRLFYEKMLSNDGSMSCATCHKQENGFDDSRQFSQGTNGSFGDRNAMPVINLGWNRHFFWDGRRGSLEGQAHDPVVNPIEMANNWPEVVRRLQNSAVYPDLFYKAFGTRTVDSGLVVKAIAQFERTIVSFNSPFDRYYFQGDSAALSGAEKRGLNIFIGQGLCKNCHLMNALFTDHEFRNNGLDVDPKDGGLMKFTALTSDRGKFKVPTLRNIALTGPYMHDGRFATLEEVVDFYDSKVRQNSPNIDEHMPEFGTGLHLTTQQKSDLVAFLKALTDREFVMNPAFSEPR